MQHSITLIPILIQLILLLPGKYPLCVLCDLRSETAFSDFSEKHLGALLFNLFAGLLAKPNESLFSAYTITAISNCTRNLIDLRLEGAVLSKRVLFLLLAHLVKQTLLFFFPL